MNRYGRVIGAKFCDPRVDIRATIRAICPTNRIALVKTARMSIRKRQLHSPSVRQQNVDHSSRRSSFERLQRESTPTASVYSVQVNTQQPTDPGRCALGFRTWRTLLILRLLPIKESIHALAGC